MKDPLSPPTKLGPFYFKPAQGHHWFLCGMCGLSVRCGSCGNNLCNGSSACQDCDSGFKFLAEYRDEAETYYGPEIEAWKRKTV